MFNASNNNDTETLSYEPEEVSNDPRPQEPNSTRCLNVTAWDSIDDKCDLVFSVIIVSILCVVGLLGNSVTIAVLRRDRDPYRQKSTNWLLQTLAIADIIYLLFAVIFLVIRDIDTHSETLAGVVRAFPYLVAYLFPFAKVAHIMTIWIVVFITVDRYLAICRPLRPEWRRLRRVKMAVAVLFILAVIYNLPRFLECKVKYFKICGHVEQQPVIVIRQFAFHVAYLYIYDRGCDFVFRSFGPLVILVILNVRIAWAIRELNKKRREMTLQAKEEKTLTVMLIIVVLIFFICQLPTCFLSNALDTAFFFPTTVRWAAFSCAFGAVNALIVMNSAINFLVYCLIWRKFNRILVRMMTCKEENINGHI